MKKGTEVECNFMYSIQILNVTNIVQYRKLVECVTPNLSVFYVRVDSRWLQKIFLRQMKRPFKILNWILKMILREEGIFKLVFVEGDLEERRAGGKVDGGAERLPARTGRGQRSSK